MKPAPPAWLDNAVFYEIYPQSFFDSNADGIGDLPGIIAKLDYVKSLGASAIWLNPCFDSPFLDAGYDVRDYYKVAPRYGTNEDLRRLFEEAHARGIRVVLDLVAGHTSVEHPWFKESARKESNEYSQYYFWTDGVRENTEGYRFINGYPSERDGYYMINFFYCQPALNFGFTDPRPECSYQLPTSHPAVRRVREEIRKIMKFYLDMGCDGFRVDMAATLVRGSDPQPGLEELWQDYRSWLGSNYPEAVLISEWCVPEKAVKAGFDIDFMLSFYTPGYASLFRNEEFRRCNPVRGEETRFSYFDRSARGDARVFLRELEDNLEKLTPLGGFLSIVSGNHDLGRIRQGRTPEELKTVYAFLFTMPGVPFLYYGDEIGMDYVHGIGNHEGSYNRGGARTPMQWGPGIRGGFSEAAPECYYLPLDAAADRPDVATQENDPESLLQTVRRLIALRRSSEALGTRGAFRVLSAENRGYPLIYERSGSDGTCIIAVNPGGCEGSGEFAAPGRGLTELFSTGKVSMETLPGAHRIAMGPVSAAIYRIQK